jgi:hypothetical protein
MWLTNPSGKSLKNVSMAFVQKVLQPVEASPQVVGLSVGLVELPPQEGVQHRYNLCAVANRCRDAFY